MLNRYDRPSPMAGEAEVKFLDGEEFRILRPFHRVFDKCLELTAAASAITSSDSTSPELTS